MARPMNNQCQMHQLLHLTELFRHPYVFTKGTNKDYKTQLFNHPIEVTNSTIDVQNNDNDSVRNLTMDP